mmetsp:Transcript_6396/g.8898  ORF Transcript_6396/g.8898 Transcript_6396/m.8898 type:complete len:1206 (+) Transcript_6396:189-3806(+)
MVWLPWKKSQTKNDDSDLMNSSPKNAVPLQDVSPEQKEHGEKKKVNKIKKMVNRRKYKHIPKWNIYPTIWMNNSEVNERKGFPSNRITTTKYSIFSFIPKNLFEQFRRATNIYFLCIVVITFVPSISPLTPITSVAPLIFVLGVSALREAYEDYMRFRADRKSNNREYEVIQPDGTHNKVPSKDLKVGTFICIKKEEPIPADTIVLTTSIEDGLCYVETSQLDGETNLKTLRALKQTFPMTEADLLKLKASVDCEEPHEHLYTFNARLQLNGEMYSLDTEQLLLRGARLRNTAWVVGLIAYTGTDTKMSLNQKNPPSKMSTLERKMNRVVGGIFAFKISCVFLFGILAGVFQTTTGHDMWYLGSLADDEGSVTGIFNFFAYFVLLSFLIPQSLMVTLEVVKVAQAKLMEWDLEMMLDENDPDSGMSAKTSNLNDELALVKYVFSDKTGTLTENKMEYSQCSINGLVYTNPLVELKEALEKVNWKPGGSSERTPAQIPSANATPSSNTSTPKVKRSKKEKVERVPSSLTEQSTDTQNTNGTSESDKKTKKKKKGKHKLKANIMNSLDNSAASGAFADQNEAIIDFLRVLAICHSVIAEEDPDTHELQYQAQSPDEVALVQAAAKMGFVFKSRKSEGVRVIEHGVERLYEVLNLIEFTSARARSSVIVRTPEGNIVLYAKGADSKMYQTLREFGSEELKKKTLHDLNAFSEIGLRTLVVAKRDLDPEWYKEWNKTWNDAKNAIKGRDEKVAEASKEVEKNLQLVGATAIEDKLQKGVPDTIDYLLRAGIKVWIITGDKQQTAINIGYSTKLLKPDQATAIINVGDVEDGSAECLKQLSEAIEKYKDTIGGIGVVIDGATLIYALKEHAKLFLKLTSMATAVVCCRVTPLQKAQIVRLVKLESKEVCLSIGDGANDVSMIQEAHIGIGIFGKEGTQAARASDYAIQQFRHLKRLLVVHGRYSLIRNAAVIHSSLYKNMAYFFTQFWFGFVNGWSAQTLYDDYMITLYNIIFTSAPPFFLALFEKDLTEDIIYENAWVYKTVQDGKMFTMKTVAGWLASAFYHSLVFFGCGCLIFLSEPVAHNGQTDGLLFMGHYVATIGIFVVLAKIAWETKYWTWVNFAFEVLSLLVYFLVLLVISSLPSSWPDGYWMFFRLFSTPSWYLTILVGFFIALVPDIVYKVVQREYFPEKWQILQDIFMTKKTDNPVELP